MTDRAEMRAAIVEEAKTWLRTPFVHAGRVKGAGVDCGQLPLAVYEAVGLFPHVETEFYSADFATHNGRQWYAELCGELGREIDHEPEPGDFVLYRLKGQRVFGHGAIVVSWPRLIHANFTQGAVCWGDDGMAMLGPRPKRFFTPFRD